MRNSFKILFLLLIFLSNLLLSQLQEPISDKLRCQQLISGPTVMAVMIRPGDEGFDDLAQLRLLHGARISSLHLTNGESIPSATWPWAQALVEAQRKEEAVRSAHVLNGASYFLNIPDVAMDSANSENEWRIDSLVNKIIPIILKVKPHLILFFSGNSLAQSRLQINIIDNALCIAADSCEKETNTNNTFSAWRVQYIVASRSTYRGISKNSILDLNRKTKEINNLANKSRLCYKSIQPVENKRINEYQVLKQVETSGTRPLIDRIQITSPSMKTIRTTIVAAGRATLTGIQYAKALNKAADSVSAYLRKGLSKYSILDQRALVNWKGDLDYLQARSGEKYFSISVKDSIVTERQLFNVSIKILNPKYKQGTNKILFHKTKKEDWVINESLERTYDLSRDSVFRVLSPEKLNYNTPIALYGLNSLTLNEPFRFSIIHQSNIQKESFILSKEVALQYSPRHASIVQTPVVPIAYSSNLIIDSYNFTRDVVDGMLFVKDTICWSDTLNFEILNKDEKQRGILNLHWIDGLPEGDYPVEISTSRRRVSSFIGRKMVFQPLNKIKTGIISDRVITPFEMYSNILSLEIRRINWTQLSDTSLANIDVLIIDRDTEIKSEKTISKITRWIKHGGSVLVLPQYTISNSKYVIDKNITFLPTSLINLTDIVSVDEFKETILGNNEQTRGVIECLDHSTYKGLIMTNNGKFLLASKRIGNGLVIYSAFDLDSWIARINLVGYKLLSKIMQLK